MCVFFSCERNWNWALADITNDQEISATNGSSLIKSHFYILYAVSFGELLLSFINCRTDFIQKNKVFLQIMTIAIVQAIQTHWATRKTPYSLTSLVAIILILTLTTPARLRTTPAKDRTATDSATYLEILSRNPPVPIKVWHHCQLEVQCFQWSSEPNLLAKFDRNVCFSSQQLGATALLCIFCSTVFLRTGYCRRVLLVVEWTASVS